jgi:hypothetical protein
MKTVSLKEYETFIQVCDVLYNNLESFCNFRAKVSSPYVYIGSALEELGAEDPLIKLLLTDPENLLKQAQIENEEILSKEKAEDTNKTKNTVIRMFKDLPPECKKEIIKEMYLIAGIK